VNGDLEYREQLLGTYTEDLFDESSCQFNLSKRHSKGSTPNLELVDVKDGGLVLWEEENDVFSGQKPLEAHLRLQVCSEK